MERFGAFSGIPRLSAKKLQIFSESGITRAPLVGIVGDFIKNGDKVFFELDYQEFWIEVEVSLFCLNKHLKIEISLRIDKNDKFENLKQDIASISICLWNHFVKKQQDFHVYDYFLLKEFEILDFQEKPKESIDLLINDVYDFDSRIKCVCEFININQYISANLAHNFKINYLQKSKLISEYLAKLSNYL
jgi:hypothetical protein